MAAFGAATNLVAGTITLTKPPAHKYWWIQNQDAAPLKATFLGSGGSVILNAATVAGAAGDWLDSKNFPVSVESVTLTSTIATHQFGCGSAGDPPYDTVEIFKR